MPLTEVTLPVLHAGRDGRHGQVEAFRKHLANRFLALRAGRRWGKTDLIKTIACDRAIKRWPVGWFAPDYKIQAEAFNEIADTLEPVKLSSNKVEGVFRTATGGRIDFWTLENERAGRSRKYKLVVVDEAAFTKPNMLDIWRKSIRPTLLDLQGSAIVCSNTNGIDADNFFWQICNQPEHGFVEFHAPTLGNPYLPDEELAKLQADNHPLVYQQEYLADFVDWGGVAFFSRDSLLVNGEPIPEPTKCDYVFAIVDSATKTGREHDGTGVTYFARNMHVGQPLAVLDWDLAQIQGALLENWLPVVFENLQHWAKRCGAREGVRGVWIEDKNTGMVLLQKAANAGWPAHPIDSKLTAVGKDERAIAVSGNVYRGEVKFCREAFEKVSSYKGASRNHLWNQVVSFRIGDKTPNREDDLLDTFCYGVALSLGGREGI